MRAAMRSLGALLLAVAPPALAQGAAPESHVQLDSEPGDPVGLGQAWSYSGDTSRIYSGGIGSNTGLGVNTAVFVDPDAFSDWSLSFAQASGAQLEPGVYEDAIKFSSYYEQHAMEVKRDSSVCNAVSGRFVVLAITHQPGGALESLAVDFEQHCNYVSAALRGQVRWNIVPGALPVANAGDDRSVLEGTPLVLDGTASSDDTGIAAWRWTQVAGVPVELLDGDSATPSVVPDIEGPATLGFRLQVTDAAGNLGFDAVDIEVLRDETDTDGDGARDFVDAFPSDPAEQGDRDGDGLGDYSDPFPAAPADSTGPLGEKIGGAGAPGPVAVFALLLAALVRVRQSVERRLRVIGR